MCDEVDDEPQGKKREIRRIKKVLSSEVVNEPHGVPDKLKWAKNSKKEKKILSTEVVDEPHGVSGKLKWEKIAEKKVLSTEVVDEPHGVPEKLKWACGTHAQTSRVRVYLGLY